MTLHVCQFLTNAIIKPRKSQMLDYALYTVVWGMMGKVISFVINLGKGSQVIC